MSIERLSRRDSLFEECLVLEEECLEERELFSFSEEWCLELGLEEDDDLL